MDLYIVDLKAVVQVDLDLKIFRMNKLGMPQERISYRLDLPQQTISRYLAKMAMLPKWLNSDLEKEFTIS